MKTPTKYWEIWKNYEEKDLVYRISLLASGFIVLILTVSLVVAAQRRPLVITVNNGVPLYTTYAYDSDKINPDEAAIFVKNFVKYYYNWTPETIGNNLTVALSFLDYDLKKESKKRVNEKVYDARQKKLSQSVYTKEIKFDPKTNQATLISERIFTIKNVKLTSNFKVEFHISKQKRSKDSPSGLLISKLTEPFDQKN